MNVYLPGKTGTGSAGGTGGGGGGGGGATTGFFLYDDGRSIKDGIDVLKLEFIDRLSTGEC
mgnify:CR=1 FL=1